VRPPDVDGRRSRAPPSTAVAPVAPGPARRQTAAAASHPSDRAPLTPLLPLLALALVAPPGRTTAALAARATTRGPVAQASTPPGDAAPAHPAPASTPPPPAELVALVARSAEAYGGRALLESHPVLIQEGTVTSAMRGGAEGRLTRIFERPVRLRVSVSFGGDTEQRVLDGMQGWREGRPVAGPPHLAMVLQAARLDLPLLLVAQAPFLRDGGTVERDGQRLRVAVLPLGDGMSVAAEIDPVTARVLRATTRLDGPPAALEFATTFSDFRRVAGQLVPFREESVAQGRRTGTTVLSSVEFPSEAPTGAFRP
jgi:hypothetical protein